MDELQKLYRELSDKGYYTKSFDEFSKQLEDDSYKQKVYDVVSKDGLYTKDYDSFSSKYYAEDIKKKRRYGFNVFGGFFGWTRS